VIAVSRARDEIESSCGGGLSFLEHLKRPVSHP
jgi:hypothetical protein